MAFRFNPLTGSLDLVVPGAGDLWSDPVDANIVPDGAGTRGIGSSSLQMANIWGTSFLAKQGAFTVRNASANVLQMSENPGTLPSGSAKVAGIGLDGGVTGNFAIFTSNLGGVDAVAANSILIEAGQKTAGTGDGGSINVTPGASVGGAAGTVNLGGIKHAYESLNSTQTLTLDQTLINTVGTITLTLPAVSGLAGKYYTFVHTGTSLTDVATIDGDGAETINGSNDFKLHTFGESVTLYCDGAIWRVSGRYIPSFWTAFTPTGNFTNTTYTGEWKRVGDSVMIQAKGVLTGTPAAATMSVDMPTNMTIDTAKLAGTASNTNTLGIIYGVEVGTARRTGAVRYNSTTDVIFANDGNINSWTEASPHTWGSTDEFAVMFTAPVSGWEG